MKAQLRRGFKAEADEYSREFRAELRLQAQDPLSPWRLAEHLEIPVVPLSALRRAEPEAVAYLLGPGRREFSAATVVDGVRRTIVHNDAHSRPRQASNLAHELAHGILGHPPRPPLSDLGCRRFDATLEAEASWLGPALLVSKEAAIAVAREGLPVEEAAARYGVSKPVMTMRLGVTGATKIAARARGRFARPAKRALRPSGSSRNA